MIKKLNLLLILIKIAAYCFQTEAIHFFLRVYIYIHIYAFLLHYMRFSALTVCMCVRCGV